MCHMYLYICTLIHMYQCIQSVVTQNLYILRKIYIFNIYIKSK